MLQGVRGNDGRIGTSSQGIGQEQTKQGGKEARYRTDQARCHFSETSQGGADTAKASLLIIIVHLIPYSDLETYGLLQDSCVSFQLPGK